MARHPLFAKRQVELKINELAVKEKRGDDSCKVWHVKAEFAKYLDMDSAELQEVAVSAGKRKLSHDPESKTGPQQSKRAKKEEDVVSDENPISSVREPKKFKRAFGFFVKAKRAEAEAELGPEASVRVIELTL